jgi:hypothetical protein
MSGKSKRTRIEKKRVRTVLDGLPIYNEQAIKDAHAYVCMSQEDLNKLEAFDLSGNVKFYEIGGVLLGKSALLKFVETIKKK